MTTQDLEALLVHQKKFLEIEQKPTDMDKRVNSIIKDMKAKLQCTF